MRLRPLEILIIVIKHVCEIQVPYGAVRKQKKTGMYAQSIDNRILPRGYSRVSGANANRPPTKVSGDIFVPEFGCSSIVSNQPYQTSAMKIGSASVVCAKTAIRSRASSFSKKIQNHAAMVAIYAVHYNFARILKALRITPAIAAGLSEHVWSLEEIILVADRYMEKPEARPS